MSTGHDGAWLEFDDARRFYVGADGMRHIPAGINARCGAGPLAVVLRPEEEIEFRCGLCWPPPKARGAMSSPGSAATPREGTPLALADARIRELDAALREIADYGHETDGYVLLPKAARRIARAALGERDTAA